MRGHQSTYNADLTISKGLNVMHKKCKVIQSPRILEMARFTSNAADSKHASAFGVQKNMLKKLVETQSLFF